MRNVTPEQVAMAEQHRRGELPDRIEGALGELAGAAKEGLMALSVVIGLTLMAIPIFMILLSTTLPARVNRTINLVVATLYIPVSVYNAAGEESWTYFSFYGLSIGLEVLLLAFILRSAWTWPRTRPHAGTVDARARRTASLADPAGTVDTWPRSEQPAWPRTSATCGPSTRSTSTYPKAAWPGSSARTVPASPPRSACCSD